MRRRRRVRGLSGGKYPVSQAELGRLIRRIRHYRRINHYTPWPVPIKEVLKLFLHLPILFDHDRSQRIWDILVKGTSFAELIENPTVLQLVRSILGHDCVLSDCSATGVGPQTEGEPGTWMSLWDSSRNRYRISPLPPRIPSCWTTLRKRTEPLGSFQVATRPARIPLRESTALNVRTRSL